jgi:maltose O-acetyltransferase
MKQRVLAFAWAVKGRYEERRLRARWARLRSIGMQIGSGVNLPMSTWIDTSHCYLISVGDNCGFGAECAILAHDAMPNEYLDATKVGRVTIHESCHFGMRTIILPGVEIGPRCIVGSGSVVNRDLPPDTVAAGNPARVLCSLPEYLNRHREWMKTHPLLPFHEFSREYLTPERMAYVQRTLDREFGYITGGYTAMVKDGKCLVRT